MLTMWYLAILHHLGWAAGPSALLDGRGPVVSAAFQDQSHWAVVGQGDGHVGLEDSGFYTQTATRY